MESRELRRRHRLLEQENEVLRRAAVCLPWAQLPEGDLPLVKELAADGIPVVVTWRVLARQPYYRRLADPLTPAELAEACSANALFGVDPDDPEFGYRFLADEAEAAGAPVAGADLLGKPVGSAFGKPRRRSGKR
ncbi:hypothetical protein [Nocardia rhamnosiphila]|uniref:Uncharacterized protein n=1 Tax=Nocardia rhamnosiphila TaxID=426716 RepID=A0ABV2WZ51_9NOCA